MLAFAHVIPRFEPAAEERFDVVWKELRNETPVHSTTQMWKHQHKKAGRESQIRVILKLKRSEKALI